MFKLAQEFGVLPSALYHTSIGELLAWNRRLALSGGQEESIDRAWRKWKRHQSATGGSWEEFVATYHG